VWVLSNARDRFAKKLALLIDAERVWSDDSRASTLLGVEVFLSWATCREALTSRLFLFVDQSTPRTCELGPLVDKGCLALLCRPERLNWAAGVNPEVNGRNGGGDRGLPGPLARPRCGQIHPGPRRQTRTIKVCSAAKGMAQAFCAGVDLGQGRPRHCLL
jgi:hypothetical protein